MNEELLTATTGWCDAWWDPEAGLLWNPEGSFDELAPARSLHLVPQSAWYALGLLARDGTGDRERATRALDRLCDLQYDEPGSVWHGTFARFPEWPPPRPGAVEWVDYDPNWRQFLATTFTLCRRSFALPARLDERLGAAIDLAIAGEPADRVGAWYSNIALMKAWLDAEHGDRIAAEGFATEIVARFDEHGAFDEYNSPTYYGIDLFALGLWRSHASSPLLREAGARIEAALWTDVARWYHAGLGNLCGPYSRAYGMDLADYAGLLGLWMWDAAGRAAAPFPDLAGTFGHSHDVSFGACVALLGARVPPPARPALTDVPGEHTVAQEVLAGAEATGWLAERVMIGAAAGIGFPARGQYHPATVHWSGGWLRLRHPAALDAAASPGRLEAVARQPGPATAVVRADGAVRVDGRRWALPGLVMDVTTDGGPWVLESDGAGLHKLRSADATRVDLEVVDVP